MTALELKNYLLFVESLYDLDKIDIKINDSNVDLNKTIIDNSGEGRFEFTFKMK